MVKADIKSQLPIVLMLGSVWGLMEAGVGMYLRGTCTAMMTGSIMTGVAIFFFSSSTAYNWKSWSIGLLFLTAMIFKLLDAFMLHLPILHGAIANPIFGFFTEALAFIFILSILNQSLKTKRYGQMILGGTSALVAVNLFPLVKFATGIAACVVPGTQLPLSLYYSPIAVLFAALTCPLGFALGEKIVQMQAEPKPRFRLSLVPAYSISVFSLVVLVLLRLK